MKEYDATELAYNNGYAGGIKELSERLINNYATLNMASEISVDAVVCDIKRIAKEMIGENDG